MASNQNVLSTNLLKNRSQLINLENNIHNIQIDSTIAGKLINLGTNSSQSKAFAKLFGYVDVNENTLYIKECIILPIVQAENKQTLLDIEKNERNIRNTLGYNYNQVGLFLISDKEGYQTEDLLFNFCHFNLLEGFSTLIVFSKEKSKFKNKNPLECFMFTSGANEIYEYKEKKEIFEPNLKKLEKMIQDNETILEKKDLKINQSPVLELIVSKTKSDLLNNNRNKQDDNLSELISSNLNSALLNQAHHLHQVLLNKKNLDLKRKNLVELQGAFTQSKELVQMKTGKLNETEKKMKLLENITN